MTQQYDPFDWYWIVGNSMTQVYSSKSGDYVQASDATYQAWLSAGNEPTHIASEAELGDVLAPYSLRPLASGVLSGYQNSQAGKLAVEIAAKVLFSHENRLRALEGKTTIIAAQFKGALREMM